jgi:hypothetical protein
VSAAWQRLAQVDNQILRELARYTVEKLILCAVGCARLKQKEHGCGIVPPGILTRYQ